MYLDKQNTLSDSQAVTVTAASTNIIDLGNDDAAVQPLNEKGDIDLLIQVVTAFTADGSATLVVAIQTDDDVGFGSPTTLYTSAAIAVADLVAGYKVPIPGLPEINEQYLRAYYTVATGPMTAGAIYAGLTLDRQTNR